MMKFLICAVLVGLLSACSAKVDGDGAEIKVNSDTKDSVKETWNDAGRELEKGAEKAKAKMEDAGDAIKEKFAEAKEKVTDDDGASVKVEVNKE